jgi:Enolase C-terminal domain-like
MRVECQGRRQPDHKGLRRRAAPRERARQEAPEQEWPRVALQRGQHRGVRLRKSHEGQVDVIIAMTRTAPARTSVGSRRPKKRLGSGNSNVRLAVHNPLGPVSTAACLHLNLLCANFGVQEQPYKPGTFLADVVSVQFEWEDGHLLPRRHPGLRVEFDREVTPVQGPCCEPQRARDDP